MRCSSLHCLILCMNILIIFLYFPTEPENINLKGYLNCYLWQIHKDEEIQRWGCFYLITLILLFFLFRSSTNHEGLSALTLTFKHFDSLHHLKLCLLFSKLEFYRINALYEMWFLKSTKVFHHFKKPKLFDIHKQRGFSEETYSGKLQ